MTWQLSLGNQNNKLGRNSAASWLLSWSPDSVVAWMIQKRARRRKCFLAAFILSQCRSNHWVWHSVSSGKWIASDSDPSNPCRKHQFSHHCSGDQDQRCFNKPNQRQSIGALEEQRSELMVALRDKIGTINISSYPSKFFPKITLNAEQDLFFKLKIVKLRSRSRSSPCPFLVHSRAILSHSNSKSDDLDQDQDQELMLFSLCQPPTHPPRNFSRAGEVPEPIQTDF